MSKPVACLFCGTAYALSTLAPCPTCQADGTRQPCAPCVEIVLPPEPVAVYADGGVIGRNPSPIGGTWAWCATDVHGTRLLQGSGTVLPSARLPVITNNQTEFVAVMAALRALPDEWSGTIYTDSQVTMYRLRKIAACADNVLKPFPQIDGLPVRWVEAAYDVIWRKGPLTYVLLSGHPTAEELRVGRSVKGLPVSEHNVWCDKECGRLARDVLGARAPDAVAATNQRQGD